MINLLAVLRSRPVFYRLLFFLPPPTPVQAQSSSFNKNQTFTYIIILKFIFNNTPSSSLTKVHLILRICYFKLPLINVGSKKKNTGSFQNVFYFIKLEPEPVPVPDLQTGSGQSVRLRNTAHRYWYQFSFFLTKIIHIKFRMRTGGSRRALGPAWRVGVSTRWSTYPGTMRPPTATGLASGYPLKQSGR